MRNIMRLYFRCFTLIFIIGITGIAYIMFTSENVYIGGIDIVIEENNIINYSIQFQTYNICLPKIIRSGGFGNRVLSYWYGRSNCFWNNYICNASMYPDISTIVNTLPTISFVDYFEYKINSPQFLYDICSFCNDLDHYHTTTPWSEIYLFCFYNKWFMKLMRQQTNIALQQFYQNNIWNYTSVTNKIKITQCDIGIHIRCGDIINYPSDKGGLLTSKFYIQSINYLLLADNMRCMNQTIKANIFIISQMHRNWRHQAVKIEKYHGREGHKRMQYICNSYTKRIGDILSSKYNHFYIVKYSNNNDMNDLELMIKLPFLITAQSTFSFYAALTRIENRYYTMLPPSRWRILSINDAKNNIEIKEKAFQSEIIPSNHFLSEQLFNITVDNYNQYCITYDFMGNKCPNYLNISSSCNLSDIHDIIQLF
eukprot:167556_1